MSQTDLVLGFVLGKLNTGDILFQAIVFVVLLLLLKKFAYGPLVEMMRKREEHIAKEIETAEKNREEAARLLEEQRKMLKEARVEGQNLIENARKQAEVQHDDIVATARQEAERMKDAAKVEIEQEKAKAVAALREQVASLSVMIASKVIEKEISEKDHEKFILDSIKEAGEMK
ncbi:MULTISPECIES: F0F1 ATP synthase subunit B [Heyndrickxia]|uniref:ATP synthase subunit b n=2 Tax=Heyndrickxia coagulans TaxID=1398 RepID=A0A150KIV8_HEYCO|nr:F0F1 ATP synthase subunit B [Heyndrickxia coagulans]MBQ4911928.1 F0F1 ATP synthase subunit B [Heyndrickxia faecalis]AJH77655.1 ATP synthase F0, B subunit [Heyndrickxia coagulans DSM 1 = ATCC 7050]APB37620.1 ATP synthase F0 subunit B [Heyndrickxia coagulans]KYC66536.1 ATP synthase B chain [Heyndrickxia coagulans]KYC73055.1 ATP synthase B chain [Heyndrickxia coagulans]